MLMDLKAALLRDICTGASVELSRASRHVRTLATVSGYSDAALLSEKLQSTSSKPN